jgi:hypothetical protein
MSLVNAEVPHRRPPQGGKPRTSLKRWARALMPLLVAAQTVPPVAWATPNPSLFAPTPMFLNVSVSSNVLFVLDDSLSMEDIRLPVPTSPAGLDRQ